MRKVSITVVGAALVTSVLASGPVAARSDRGAVIRQESHPRPLPLATPDHHPARAAMAHLTQQSTAWRVTPANFTVDRISPIGGGATVRFQQRIGGYRALGGYLALTVTSDGALVSEIVRSIATPGNPEPTWSVQEAKAAASDYIAAGVNLLAVEPVVVDGSTVPSYGAQSRFVWLISSASPDHQQTVTVMADGTGEVLWTSGRQRHATSGALICDYRDAMADALARPQATGDYPLCTTTISGDNYVPRAGETAAPADLARLDAGIAITLDYYSGTLAGVALGQDDSGNATTADVAGWEYLGNIAPALNFGIDYSDLSQPLRSANSCDSQSSDPSCAPMIHALVSSCDGVVAACTSYPNAYWSAWSSSRCNDPTSAVDGYCGAAFFGRGWAMDDIIAHELTHGVTAYAFPFDTNAETNALAEAYSDFIAEAVDQTNVKPGEVADLAWKFGEDVLPADAGLSRSYLEAYGALRTMRGTLPGELQRISASWNPRGNEHYNLGPADRFAWLIANGGSQRGYTITALGTSPWVAGSKSGLCSTGPLDTCTGIRRMSMLVMSALPLMPGPFPTYYDFGRAIVLACRNLATLGTEGFTSTSCGEVRQALLATNILGIKFSPSVTKLGTVRRGAQRTVTAILKTSTGARAVGVPVKFQMRSARSKPWVTLATTTTTSSGRATFTVTLNKSAYYRFVTVKSADVPLVASRTRWVRVR